MSKFRFNKYLLFLSLAFLLTGIHLEAQTIHLDASKLTRQVDLFFSPRIGSFVEQSTFDVPILLNTKGASINGVEIKINYDRNKLEIIKPSSGLSIIGVWVEPPSYDNTRGIASYVGVIPGGITTSSGLVGTITFKTKSTGKAIVSFGSNSKVLLNDGLGSEAQIMADRAEYSIVSKPPEGVNIFSETHPFQDKWYNNNSPIVDWDKDLGVAGFSYVLDDKPSTIPDNTVIGSETTKQFTNLNDGLWYFHIKAIKNGVWGATGHFLIRIDNSPPADFTPEINYLIASVILTERALVSFFTTDNLSGVDHYEVGVIDRTQPVTVSPVFVQTESPFQVELTSDNLSVIARAVDGAGNVRDAAIAVSPPSLVGKFVRENLVYILLFIIFVGLISLILHYLIGHHILRYLRKAVELVKKEEQITNIEQSNIPPIQ